MEFSENLLFTTLAYNEFSDYYTVDNEEDTVVSTGSDPWQFQAIEDTFIYGSLTVMIVGVIGNILSFIIMAQKSMRTTVSTLFFLVLSVVDILTIILVQIRYFGIGIEFGDIRVKSNIVCKSHAFLVYWLSDLSAWILVCVTIERCIGVHLPHKHKVSILLLTYRILFAHYLLIRDKKAFYTLAHFDVDC